MKLQYALVTIIFIAVFACQTEKETEQKTVAPTGYEDIDNITRSITNNPSDPQLYFARASMYYEYNGYENAINDLQQALAIDSTNMDYLHLLADVYLDYYKSRLALETMEKTVELYPEHIYSLLKLSEFQLILTKHEASLKTIDRILKLDAQNAEAYFMMGMTFKDMQDTARAINSFQEAVDLNSDLVDGWLELGQLFASLENPIAIQYFDNAIRVAPEDVTVLHAKAFYLANTANDLEAALEVYKKINIIDPQYEEAYFNAGLLYLDLDRLDEARQQFEIATNVSPTHIRAYYYRGLTSELLGNLSDAKVNYEQALRMAPDYAEAQEGLQRLQQLQ